MVKHLKLFENHADYAAFIETEDFIRPNVSHCVAENDVHYNPVLYYLTPKQIVEYAHSFIASLDEKFLLHRQEHTDMDRGEYLNTCEHKITQSLYTLSIEKNLRYRNMQTLLDAIDLSYYPNNNNLFGLDVYSNLILTDIRFNNGDDYIGGDIFLYKTDETYNGNDVFYFTEFEPTYDDCSDFDELHSLIEDTVLYGDNMVLLSPNGTYANFSIAYPDGNGGYTTTKPASMPLTPSIIDDTLWENSDWISLTLFNRENQEINTRVDNAVAALKTDFRNWHNGNFSAFSVLDDIKLEVPKDVYEIIKNPWTYLDEEDIFDGQLPNNPSE